MASAIFASLLDPIEEKSKESGLDIPIGLWFGILLSKDK